MYFVTDHVMRLSPAWHRRCQLGDILWCGGDAATAMRRRCGGAAHPGSGSEKSAGASPGSGGNFRP